MECDWIVFETDGTYRRCPGGESQMPAGNGALYCATHHEEFYRWFTRTWETWAA